MWVSQVPAGAFSFGGLSFRAMKSLLPPIVTCRRSSVQGRRRRRNEDKFPGEIMAQQRLGIIMSGVTGRMGMNQHLIRSICAIRDQGGVALKNGDRVMPDPILVGRSADRLQKLAKAHGITRWTTDLDKTLKDKKDTLFFDAATTQLQKIRCPSCP